MLMPKTTEQMIDELERIANTMDAIGDADKAGVIREACERLSELDSIEKFIREGAAFFVRSE